LIAARYGFSENTSADKEKYMKTDNWKQRIGIGTVLLAVAESWTAQRGKWCQMDCTEREVVPV
jgi:hypothetical protein